MIDEAAPATASRHSNDRPPGPPAGALVPPGEDRGWHDIRDPERFVNATINASRRIYSPDERAELVAEGLAILWKLASDFEPHRDGYEHGGRFSGFAAKYLRLKLEDAYHRLHPEHQLRTADSDGKPYADGKRHWHHGERAVSLEAIVAEDPDRHGLLAGQPDEADLRGRVAQALDERWARRREMILDVAEALGSGASWSDAAVMLGLSPQIVREAVNEIALVADRLESNGS